MATLKDAKRIVIKVGTSTLTHSTGKTNIRQNESVSCGDFGYCKFWY